MNQYTIHFETLGCRLNQDETEGAARSFANNGFKTDLELLTAKAPVDENTILCMINTCTVTGKAEQKARRIIRLMLQKFPKAPVIVTGCYAELDKAEIKAMDENRISVLAGTKKYILSKIAQAITADGPLSYEKGLLSAASLDDFIQKNYGNIDSTTVPEAKRSGITAPSASRNLDMFSLYTPVFEKHSRSSLKIQDGCNNECAFCRIHLARGKSISLDVPTVVSRVKELEERGMAEVVLTGVNLSQYRDIDADGNRTDFALLLKTLLENTSSIKFRISSFYPQHITPSLCEVLKDPRVQPFFHLSIQSGSDRILKAMRRPYDRQCVLTAASLLRKAKDNPFISCDIIAGFPGESEEDFKETEKICREVDFAWIHAFPFSPRPGTPAYTMKPQIPERIKDERVKWLTQAAVDGKCAYIESFIGKEMDAIVENNRSQRLGREEGKTIHCVTGNFLHVQCSSEKELPSGSVIRIRITALDRASILGGKETEATGEIVS